MSQANPYTLVRGPVDLTTCDLEPVHQIGTVQSHGALLVFEAASGRLLEASSNWRQLMPEAPRGNVTLRDLFDESVSAALEGIQHRGLSTVLPADPTASTELSAHRHDGYLLVEVEQTRNSQPFDPIAALNSVTHGVGGAQSSGEYLQALASELRRALAIDHVMIYHFLPDWAGEVVAESTLHGPEYLGLHFPATDIPEPARRVFCKVWVRHIADIAAPPYPVQGDGGEGLSGLDLTQVGIRAASPIHLEYLANMGVKASLTLSLRIGERLWGLVACHHRTPYLLRPSARASLEILAQISSLQLSSLLQNQTSEQRRDCDHQLAELERKLEISEETYLSSYLVELQTLLDADMVAIYEDGRWTRKAGVPLDALDRFLAWYHQQAGRADLFHRNDLPPDLVPGYVGVLVVAPADAQGRLVCWFRYEQSHSVRWAGNPHKTDVTPSGRLNPRASFAEYVELTQGKSLPWTELDLWKADRFREVLGVLSLRLHRRLQQRNEALARSNRELDSFAYMASHDLKEPLRGIHNYSTFLKEDYADRLDGDGMVFLNGLTDLARRMTVMVDALLAYSRLNSQNLEISDCDLGALARDTCDLLRITRKAELTVLEPLPVVQAYPPFLSEIVVNLLTNAIKYSDEPNRRIELGSLEGDPAYDTFFVRDNGIGIPQEFHEEIFELFRRLHGEGQRGDGSGVGLTIVKRMVERHAGKVWVESQPGQGSTFFVALPRLNRQLPRGDTP